MKRRKVVIIGAAGRDFHNFNTRYRSDETVEVVAFTAAQIPGIEGRRYPPELAGPLYPDGIPIHPEHDLADLIVSHEIDECVFSYSDISYDHVMRVSAIVMSAGASFTLLGPTDTQIRSTKPVVAVCAVRTGAGKSQTARRVVEVLMSKGLKVVAVRHPMPYGNLAAQKVQRFAEIADLERHECTIEEMEEYEPHIARGNVIYSGNDYEAIARAAEADPEGCDVIVWDGGNNDVAFFVPDLLITVVDPHRPGHELSYYPGEVNFRRANVIVINKMDSAGAEGIAQVKANIAEYNPTATVIQAASPPVLADPDMVRGKRVLVVEDGPTLTHGGMKIGAGVVAAMQHGATAFVDPRPYLQGSLVDTFRTYPDIGTVLPAMGYGADQMKDLAATIEATDCDVVVIGTPIDLSRVLEIGKPHTRVTYDLDEIGHPDMDDVLSGFVEALGLA